MSTAEAKEAPLQRVTGVMRLVHVEEFATAIDAIAREKALKKWPRRWKIDLIERDNPTWVDLARWRLD
jgi:putative endonuclease